MNIDFDAFTYVTGIATLLGLILQLKDSFPEHRETRKTIFLLVIGIFMGSVIASLKGVKVEFGATISSFEVIGAIFIVVLATAAIVATFTKEANRRYDLFRFLIFGTVALFMLLFVGNVSGIESNRDDRNRKRVSIEELMELSELNTSRGNFERALMFLDEVKNRLPRQDERISQIDNRIQYIKQKQIAK